MLSVIRSFHGGMNVASYTGPIKKMGLGMRLGMNAVVKVGYMEPA